MRSLSFAMLLCISACTPTVSTDTYPVTIELPHGGIHLLMQSQHSNRPEICVDSNTNRHIELHCDRGTRRFDRPAEFSLPAGQDGLGVIPKNLHLGDGRFISTQLEVSLETPFFFVRGDAQPMLLTQPATSTPNFDWAYHPSDGALWFSVSRDDSRICPNAAVIFRSADGSQKHACIEGFDHLTLHPNLPFATLVGDESVRMFRLDPEAGTATVLGDIGIPDAGARILFDMHRPVLYVQSTDRAWAEVTIGADDALSAAPSQLGKLLYWLAAVEDSSLEGGDTLLWGDDSKGVAILMKEGRPVARFDAPDESSNVNFIQAGHELYVGWFTDRDGKRYVNLAKPTRVPIE